MLKDQGKTEAVLKDLTEKVVKNGGNRVSNVTYNIEKDEQYQQFKATVVTTKFSKEFVSHFNHDMAHSTELDELRNLWSLFVDLIPLPMKIRYSKEESEFSDYLDFYNYFMEASKRGQYVQRYKGLGEMNPEQLWETTLNPENRTLLQVTVHDAMSADETFSILMGEEVEPRRKFIDDNALLVNELDV